MVFLLKTFSVTIDFFRGGDTIKTGRNPNFSVSVLIRWFTITDTADGLLFCQQNHFLYSWGSDGTIRLLLTEDHSASFTFFLVPAEETP